VRNSQLRRDVRLEGHHAGNAKSGGSHL
jgi:hypothetical protein